MAYLTNFEWLQQLDYFTDEQKKILLALSHDKYKWRTRDRLIDVTGLKPEELDTNLSRLLSENIIRPSFSKKKDIIFGLRERVDKDK